MANTINWYAKAFINAFKKKIDYTDGNIKVALTNNYTPDQANHEFFSDVTNEVSGAGYTTGGISLANVSMSYNTTSKVISITCNDYTFSTSTVTADGGVIYYSTGVASTSPLIAYMTFDADYISSIGNFTLDFDSTGILSTTIT